MVFFISLDFFLKRCLQNFPLDKINHRNNIFLPVDKTILIAPHHPVCDERNKKHQERVQDPALPGFDHVESCFDVVLLVENGEPSSIAVQTRRRKLFGLVQLHLLHLHEKELLAFSERFVLVDGDGGCLWDLEFRRATCCCCCCCCRVGSRGGRSSISSSNSS
jgi:hypothetical protein